MAQLIQNWKKCLYYARVLSCLKAAIINDNPKERTAEMSITNGMVQYIAVEQGNGAFWATEKNAVLMWNMTYHGVYFDAGNHPWLPFYLIHWRPPNQTESSRVWLALHALPWGHHLYLSRVDLRVDNHVHLTGSLGSKLHFSSLKKRVCIRWKAVITRNKIKKKNRKQKNLNH